MLSIIAAISGLYDFIAGALLLWGADADSMAGLFDLPAGHPPIFPDLNAIFLMAVGIGYVMPWRDAERHRGYLWVMGPLLKGAGAAAFLFHYFTQGAPRSFLLFAASDGILAIVTLVALLASRPRAA